MRRAADAQHRVAAFEEPLGNRVEDLVEGLVANLPGAGERDERQREPLADDGHVSGAVDRQRVRFHDANVLRHPRRIVVGARAIRSGDENHLARELARYPRRLKNCTARSCFSAAARVLKVPRFLRWPVFESIFFE